MLHIATMLSSGAALTVIAVLAAGQGVQNPFQYPPSVAVGIGCTSIILAGLVTGFYNSNIGAVLLFAGLLGANANQFGSAGNLLSSEFFLLCIPMALLFADGVLSKNSTPRVDGSASATVSREPRLVKRSGLRQLSA
jgi:hypothetical protein